MKNDGDTQSDNENSFSQFLPIKSTIKSMANILDVWFKEQSSLSGLKTLSDNNNNLPINSKLDFSFLQSNAAILRVLARIFDIDNPIEQEQTIIQIQKLAKIWASMLSCENFITEHMTITHLQTLGDKICVHVPLCAHCPLHEYCECNRLKITDERPILGKDASDFFVCIATGILECAKQEGQEPCFFVQKRLPTGAWAGLWEFPGGRIEQGEIPEQTIVREFKEETGFDVQVKQSYGITRHKHPKYDITLHCFGLNLQQKSYKPTPTLTAASDFAWLSIEDIRLLNLPGAHRKILDILDKSIK